MASRFSLMRLILQMLLRWMLSPAIFLVGRSQVMIRLQLPATNRARSYMRSMVIIQRPWLKTAYSLKNKVTISSVIRSSLTSNILIWQSQPSVTTPNPPGLLPFRIISKMQPSCNFCEISKGCSGLKGPWLAFQKLMLPQRFPTSRYLSMTANPYAPSGRMVLMTQNSSSMPQTLIRPLAGCLLQRSARQLLQTNCFSLRMANFLTSRLWSLLLKWRQEVSLPAQRGTDWTVYG